MPEVPFNRAYLAGNETGYVAQAIASGATGGDGSFTKKASALVSSLTGTTSTLLTTSCTHALELSALLLDIGPGDEIIMPSFTFTSTANAFVLRGATPVFVDIRPDTLNLDERLIENAVTGRTRAIVVVHYAGVACEMAAILAIANRHRLVVVEDNAHGLGGSYAGRPLGSFGVLATQSFHVTKNVQCGEGGALAIGDERLSERAEIVREKGTDRARFFRGQVDKYCWRELGSSYLPSDVLAAYLLGQLEAFPDIQGKRLRIWSTYDDALADWSAEHGIQRPTVPADRTHPAHLYYLLLPTAPARDEFIRHLAERGVRAAHHYQPLHSAPAGRRYARTAGCPVTEDIADRLVRLPLFAGMTAAELEHVVVSAISYAPAVVTT
ncbi:dTDP-4-amino-4,6-dideoxygalactose transaminase [Fodinicola acaciae]|uniref:dTDP-4-amino-4,6-dideoxygalactose transaminase n=1 Tax=Fodinicola acaciae TaxID=2681555 RepID=UPI0013D0EDFF|nr:dTDP-4-amino-4,6-dideoxygalactose transaminase [Fodinicola acaciae]